MSEDDDVIAGPPTVDEPVGVVFEPGVIRIRLQRPPVNALTVEIIDRLSATLRALRDDPRPVMLCGSSRVFSAGFDVKQPAGDPHLVDAAARACLDAMRAHPSPTIAAVEGAAVGLGLLIAASADILAVSRAASFRMPEVTLGIASDIDGLRRFLPELWVRRLCLSGERFTVEELHLEASGAMVCEPGTCDAVALSVAERFGTLPPQFLRDAKRQLSVEHQGEKRCLPTVSPTGEQFVASAGQPRGEV
jgi:enoyl-CoA hydratase/carnithine racemase